MDHAWNAHTPLARQAAAAEMWMELTGRTKQAQVAVFEEAAEKLGAAPLVTQPGRPQQPQPPKLKSAVGKGGFLGGAIGAGIGAGLEHASMSRPEVADAGVNALRRAGNTTKAGLRVGSLGAGLGMAAGLGGALYNRHRKKQQQKLGSVKERLYGAAGGAAALGGLGAYKAYKSHRAGADGRSMAQNLAQAELDQMRALYEHQGRDLDQLPGMSSMRHRFAQAKLKAYEEARETPGHAAAASGIPWAAGGALAGAVLAPQAARVAGRVAKRLRR